MNNYTCRILTFIALVFFVFVIFPTENFCAESKKVVKVNLPSNYTQLTDQVKAQLKDLYKTAKSKFAKKEYELSRNIFEEIVKINPDYYLAKISKKYIGKIDLILKQESEKKEKQRKEEEYRKLYKEASKEYKEKNYSLAKTLIQQALEILPEKQTGKVLLKTIEAKERYLESQISKKQKKEVKKLRQSKKEKNSEIISEGSAKTLNIEECIKIAVDNYPALVTACAQEKLAKIKIWEARRNLFPKASVLWSEGSGEIYGEDYKSRRFGGEVSQKIFDGGETIFIIKQAEINLEVTRADAERIKNDLILSVKKAYYGLIKSKHNYNYQKDIYEESQRILTRIETQHKEKIVSEIEYLNVSSQCNQIKYQLISAEKDIEIAKLILKQAMTVDPGFKFDIANQLEFKKAEVNFGECLRLALLNRPEIRLNELLLKYYQYDKKIAKGKYWPDIEASGAYYQAGEVFKEQDLDLTSEWFVMGKVRLPIWGNSLEYSYNQSKTAPVVSAYHGTNSTTHTGKFSILDDLRLFSRRQEAEVDYDRIYQDLIKVKSDIRLEVQEQFFSFEKALILFELAKEKVTFQGKELELFKLRRDYGELEDSKVIESLIKLAEEQYGYMQALTEYFVSIAALNRAVGINDYINTVDK